MYLFEGFKFRHHKLLSYTYQKKWQKVRSFAYVKQVKEVKTNRDIKREACVK